MSQPDSPFQSQQPQQPQYSPQQPQYQPGQLLPSTPPQSDLPAYQGQAYPAALQPERSLGGKLTKALLAGLATVVVGALAWGGLAYLTERIFVFIALAIGFAVSFVVLLPFKRPIPRSLTALLFIPVLLFTAASVLLGDFFYATLTVAKELNLGFGEAASEVRAIYFDVLREGGEALKSLLFALLGAGLGFFNAIKRK